MRKITKEDLAELIDVDRLKDFVDDKTNTVTSIASSFFPSKKTEEKDPFAIVKTIIVIVGIVACVAAIAYAVYRYLTPDYDEAFDDDFDDEFDDDDEDLFEEDSKKKS